MYMESSAMTTSPRIAIIGGGPGGLMLARLLQVRGMAATVFERDAHAGERPQGGSLDLHEETGLRALRIGGLEKAFLAQARPEDQGDRLFDAEGTLLFDDDGQDYGRPEIDRTALRRLLLASLMPETVQWQRRVDTIKPGAQGDWLVSTDGKAESFGIVVGADGAWSRVRPLLSDAVPIYEGVTFVELGFDSHRHPQVDALIGKGKMFAVGDNRLLVAQRNGHGHIRGYAAHRMSEDSGRELTSADHDSVRGALRHIFAGWSPKLTYLIEKGDVLGTRPLFALQIGHRWHSRPGITLLGDAAHLMSPFAGEGVNLALADAADLADALASGAGWAAVARCEATAQARAQSAAVDAAEGLRIALSPEGVAGVLEHYKQRVAVSVT
jgi:2-polyprenyl-6-methoxyphenol hydroxylase-like FAD-dependent oxidoreductase